MALSIFALLVILSASLASAGPVAIDNATLFSNGEQALLLNCQFQNLQTNDSCTTGDIACIQGNTAACVGGAWQTQACPSGKSCFALPSVRANGTFIACTSSNNADSIISATGVQTNITNNNNCTSFPFSTSNTTAPGDSGQNSTQGGNVGCGTPSVPPDQPTLTLPPTSTTLSPEQASSLISFLSNTLNPPPSVPSSNPDIVNNLGGNTNGTAPIIQLTPRPISLPTPTPVPASSSPY